MFNVNIISTVSSVANDETKNVLELFGEKQLTNCDINGNTPKNTCKSPKTMETMRKLYFSTNSTPGN